MSLWYSMGVCALYSVLSTGCILHNKYVLSNVVPHEDILMISQNVFCITFILLLGKYHDGSAAPTKQEFSLRRAIVPRYTIYHTSGDWVVGFCYSLSVVTGMWCLYHLTVPTFAAVKKSGMIIQWLIELANPTTTTWSCLPSLVLVMAGSMLQTWYDLEFSAVGVFFGALSCLFQGIAFELGKRMVTHGKDLWSVLLINSVVSLVVQIVYMTVYGETHIIADVIKATMFNDGDALSYVTNRKVDFSANFNGGDTLPAARATSTQVWLHISANCILIMMMNFSIFLNCTVNSPLAHVVTGNVKSLVTTVAGILMFSLTVHYMGYVGIVVGFLGGAWFSWVKYRDDQQKRAQKAAAAAAEKQPLVESNCSTVAVCINDKNVVESAEQEGEIALETKTPSP